MTKLVNINKTISKLESHGFNAKTRFTFKSALCIQRVRLLQFCKEYGIEPVYHEKRSH